MVKTCGKDGCCPVEQIRGQIGPGDYYDVVANNTKRYIVGVVEEPEKYGVPVRTGEQIPAGIEQRHCVEIDVGNENDFRICCKTCGKAMAWNPKDLPGMPDAGADWTRKRWDDSVGG